MTRIPVITSKDDLSPEHHTAFDEIAASRGRIVGPFQVLLNSPELARRIAHTGSYVRYESVLPADVRELLIITSARENDCQFEWTSHEALAREAGVRDEAITAVRDRKAPEGLTPEEALIVTYVQELIQGNRVSEATFQATLDRFGVQGTVELTGTIGYYSMLATALNAFDVQPETPLLPL